MSRGKIGMKSLKFFGLLLPNLFLIIRFDDALDLCADSVFSFGFLSQQLFKDFDTFGLSAE